jgi:hypothetical protein
MWKPLKRLLAKSSGLSDALGPVVWEGRDIHARDDTAFFRWRVKKSLDDRRVFLSPMFRASRWSEGNGITRLYFDFDIAAAIHLRDELDDCIAAAEREEAAIPDSPSDRNR